MEDYGAMHGSALNALPELLQRYENECMDDDLLRERPEPNEKQQANF